MHLLACEQVMYCGENRLRSLPSRFGQLAQLQELDVSGCELESLPESFSHCTSLVTLWLSNNRLFSNADIMLLIM